VIKSRGKIRLFCCEDKWGRYIPIYAAGVGRATNAEAIKKIQAKHGTGEIRIYQAPVQPRRGLIWWEYNIEVT